MVKCIIINDSSQLKTRIILHDTKYQNCGKQTHSAEFQCARFSYRVCPSFNNCPNGYVWPYLHTTPHLNLVVSSCVLLGATKRRKMGSPLADIAITSCMFYMYVSCMFYVCFTCMFYMYVSCMFYPSWGCVMQLKCRKTSSHLFDTLHQQNVSR